MGYEREADGLREGCRLREGGKSTTRGRLVSNPIGVTRSSAIALDCMWIMNEKHACII